MLQALQVASIVVGGIWFLYQYNLGFVKERKQESLKYAEKFYEHDISNDMSILERPFDDPDFKQQVDKALKESYSNNDICPIRTFYLRQIVPLYYSDEQSKQQFFNSLTELSGFFTSLAICANSGVCDINTACNFFFYPAHELLNRHCTYLDSITLNFGYSPVRDIEQFLRSCNDSDRFRGKIKALSYCEEIRQAAGKSLEQLYQPCSP
jgi:hypothetical protein